MKVTIGYYRHYKGGIYYVTAVAQHESTGEALVIYHGLSGTWARDYGNFIGMVEVDGAMVPRFIRAGRDE